MERLYEVKASTDGYVRRTSIWAEDREEARKKMKKRIRGHETIDHIIATIETRQGERE